MLRECDYYLQTSRNAKWRHAAKQHACAQCQSPINAGDSYFDTGVQLYPGAEGGRGFLTRRLCYDCGLAERPTPDRLPADNDPFGVTRVGALALIHLRALTKPKT